MFKFKIFIVVFFFLLLLLFVSFPFLRRRLSNCLRQIQIYPFSQLHIVKDNATNAVKYCTILFTSVNHSIEIVNKKSVFPLIYQSVVEFIRLYICYYLFICLQNNTDNIEFVEHHICLHCVYDLGWLRVLNDD